MKRFTSYLSSFFSGEKYIELLIVLVCGALGGIVSIFVFPPANINAWVIFRLVVLGALAGGVGVYILANTKTENKNRLIIFAILCGIAQQPILERGIESLFDKKIEEAGESVVKLENASEEQLPGVFQELAKNSTDLLDYAKDNPSDETKVEVRQTVENTIDALEKNGTKAPDAAAQAAAEIAKATIRSGERDLTLKSVQSMVKLTEEAKPLKPSKTFSLMGDIVKTAESKGDTDLAMDVRRARAARLIEKTPEEQLENDKVVVPDLEEDLNRMKVYYEQRGRHEEAREVKKMKEKLSKSFTPEKDTDTN